MNMEDSIFTKIIKGEIPASKIYEDDRTLAFLDVKPARTGHTLVVTKVQVDQYLDLSDEDYDALWKTVRLVARQLKAKLHVDRVAVNIVGIDVPHTHVHLIPFNVGESMTQDSGSPSPSLRDLEELAEKLHL
jgi:histidine triad (HIT) family protein